MSVGGGGLVSGLQLTAIGDHLRENPGWEGSATIVPACLLVLEASSSWKDGRLPINLLAERMMYCRLPIRHSS